MAIKKETLATGGKEVNDLIYLFKDVNPSYEKLFGNKNQRQIVERMLKKYGFAKMEAMIKALPDIIVRKYAPRITKPSELEDKLGSLIAFVKQERQRKGGVHSAIT